MWRRDKEAERGRRGEQAEEEEGKWGQLRGGELGESWELGERLDREAGWGKLSKDGHRPQDSRVLGSQAQRPCQTLHRPLIADSPFSLYAWGRAQGWA